MSTLTTSTTTAITLSSADPTFTLASTGTINTTGTNASVNGSTAIVSGASGQIYDVNVVILGTDNAGNGGVLFRDGGTLSVGGTGVINSAYAGVTDRSTSLDAVTIINAGIINSGTVNGTTGTITNPAYAGVAIDQVSLVLNNSGLIKSAAGPGVGVDNTAATGNIINSGTILSTYVGDDAIDDTSGTITNTGTITDSGGTSAAIVFSVTGDTVIIGAGSKITGQVEGFGSSLNNTLVLSGTAIENYNPAQYVDFNNIVLTGSGLHTISSFGGTNVTVNGLAVQVNGSITTPTSVSLVGGDISVINGYADPGLSITFGSAFAYFNDPGTNFAGTIANFSANSEIVTANSFNSTDYFTYSNGTGTLLSHSGTVLQTFAHFTPAASEPASGTIALFNAGNLIAIGCFYAGVQLATPDGEIAVEDLREGDLLLTADGSTHPVRWVGQSQISTTFADPLRFLPIRITEGALGDGLPVRDLLVSPDHALLVDGILVQAGALVNGVTILREQNVPTNFTYYHVEMAHHALLIADGALAESFVDNIDRMNFHNWQDRTAPMEPIQEMDLPRAKAARQVPSATRARLAGKIAA